MIRIKITVALILLLVSSCYSQQGVKTIGKKTRAESFFGLHFDFHATLNDKHIGKTLTEGAIDSLLGSIKPDYIQVDSKGHPGYTSYPTQVGIRAGGFDKDQLHLFRKVTERHNTALFVHYSGVWDSAAILKHPTWARITEKGERDNEKTSFFSPYSDSLLIPQLKELSSVYKVDGAWIDGDCWAVKPDYNDGASKAFMDEYHVSVMPKKFTDPHYTDLLQFTRTKFKQYVAHYVTAIHQFNPQFQITSNWAYSGFMPEEVDLNLDFLSGDLASQGGVYSAALEARCLESKGKPWDLMAWSFTYDFGNGFRSAKSAMQLKQEAAEVLAMGGGFQIYFIQNRDASIPAWIVPVAKDVADFCREREIFCHKAVTVPQVAVLYSQESYKKKFTGLYGYFDGIVDEMKGTMMSMLDGQYSVQIKLESQLRGHMQEFPLIVIPGWEYLEEDFIDEVVEYVKNGGTLLLSGPGPINLFNDKLNLIIKEEVKSRPINLGFNNYFASVRSSYLIPQFDKSVITLGGFYYSEDFRSPATPAGAIIKYGKGKVALSFANLGTSYLKARTDYSNYYLNSLVKEVFADPVVDVKGSDLVHVNVTEKNAKRQIHLINIAGTHDDRKVYSFSEIPPLHDLQLKLRVLKKPTRVTLQPDGKPLKYSYEKGVLLLTLPVLKVYSIVEIE